jgi:hypothetical protein
MKYIYQEFSHTERIKYTLADGYEIKYKNISFLRYLYLKFFGYHCRKVLNVGCKEGANDSEQS